MKKNIYQGCVKNEWFDLAEHCLKYKYVDKLDCKQTHKLVATLLKELHDNYGWRTREEVAEINRRLTKTQQELAALKKELKR